MTIRGLTIDPIVPGFETRYLSVGHFPESWYSQFHQLDMAVQLVSSSRKACKIYFKHFMDHWSYRAPLLTDEEMEIHVDNCMKPGNVNGGFNYYRANLSVTSNPWTELDQTVSDLPTNKRDQLLAAIQLATPDLAGRKVLIVDDDIRNIFALTGALEQHGITVLNAENGKDGLETLKNNPDIDVILMDIMMPELDGYDTIRIIRGLQEFKNLPIIAVTAKAMKGDREKCLEAGASDYISKPVNIEQLLSLLRVGLAK